MTGKRKNRKAVPLSPVHGSGIPPSEAKRRNAATAPVPLAGPVLPGRTPTSDTAALGPLGKFFLVPVIAIPAAFAIGGALRRAPLARSIL